jgi:predicted TIM-barrel fold metal-dependent hydrolase
MLLDGHIHITSLEGSLSAFRTQLTRAGMDGALLISLPPPPAGRKPDGVPADRRIAQVLEFTEGRPNMFPFLWIDPMDDEVFGQIDEAVRRGIAGFKVICHNHYPGDDRAMKVFRRVAAKGKPILFHSGILWDGQPSSRYNRPAEFEALLDVEELRFSLAHIGWPWCDELIAVYGKFLNAYSRRPDLGVEMFVDVTPGTPEIYRHEVLTKLFGVGYDVEDNVVFGSDCSTAPYNERWTRDWIARDRAIYQEIGVPESAQEKIFSGNLLRFVGLSRKEVKRKTLTPADS